MTHDHRNNISKKQEVKGVQIFSQHHSGWGGGSSGLGAWRDMSLGEVMLPPLLWEAKNSPWWLNQLTVPIEETWIYRATLSVLCNDI